MLQLLLPWSLQHSCCMGRQSVCNIGIYDEKISKVRVSFLTLKNNASFLQKSHCFTLYNYCKFICLLWFDAYEVYLSFQASIFLKYLILTFL